MNLENLVAWQRQFFDPDDEFNIALGIMQEETSKPEIYYLSRVQSFLQNRGINYGANISDIYQSSPSKARLLGEAIHFQRKATLKNYEYRDPAQVTDMVLDALEPVGDEYAANFLESICKLMTQDSKPQQFLSTSIIRELPEILEEYNSRMESVTEKDAHKSEKLKMKILGGYTWMLDAYLKYAEDEIKNSGGLTFNEYFHAQGGSKPLF